MNDWRKIRREAKRAGDSEIPDLYHEVFGASFSGDVTPSRARDSIIEACEEMIHMAKGKTEFNIEAAFQEMSEKLDRVLAAVNGRKPDPKYPVDVVKDNKVVVPEAKPEPAAVTIEKLREVATRYSTAFGIKDLLELVGKHGAKKLSEVAEADYPLLASDMEARITRENGKKATTTAPAETAKAITLDEVKPKAKAFMDKNGAEALGALLKSFGAKKLSEVPQDKLAALHEALANA